MGLSLSGCQASSDLRFCTFFCPESRDKGLLERCGTENGYLNEVRAVRSDLRVCASGEPESEPKGPGPGCSVNR
jgi:hypothetical protein